MSKATKKNTTNGAPQRVQMPEGFQAVSGQARHLEVGESFVATYRGLRTIAVRGQGESIIHSFEREDGSTDEVWGGATLNRQMAAIGTNDRFFVMRGDDLPAKKKNQSPMKVYFVGAEKGKARKVEMTAKKGKKTAKK